MCIRDRKGTVIAAMVSDELTDAATQMTALFPFMKQLVTSGKYDGQEMMARTRNTR